MLFTCYNNVAKSSSKEIKILLDFFCPMYKLPGKKDSICRSTTHATCYKSSKYDFSSIIEKDPASHIHIPMLADKAGINEFKLKVGFRELFQTSPYQYRLRLCLVRAKELLEVTDDTIDQIAAKVGFDTYNGFSTAFKKAFNIPPTVYRNRQTA